MTRARAMTRLATANGHLPTTVLKQRGGASASASLLGAGLATRRHFASDASSSSPSSSPPPPPPTSSSPSSTSSNQSVFYQNRLFERYWSQEARRVTLRQLCVHGRNITPQKLIASANYVRNELPVRLSHRIRDFQALPFVVGTDPNISRVYELYMSAFDSFRKVGEIKTMEDNESFCALLAQQLYWHLEVIPLLAKGMVEAATARHMDPNEVDRFMYTTLRSRIGRRVIAEQHIALTNTYHEREKSGGKGDDNSPFIGIVNTRTRAGSIVERCARLARKVFAQSYGSAIQPPEIIVDGDVDAEFTYIPDQAEYVVYELLENAIRFTLYEHHPKFKRMKQTAASALGEVTPKPWVQATVDSGASVGPLDRMVADPGSIQRFEQHVPGHDLGRHGHGHLHHAKHASAAPAASNTAEQEVPTGEAGDELVKLPPVRVTCAMSPTPTSTTPSLQAPGSSSGSSNATTTSFAPIIAFRISDRGGGIPRPLVPHIFSFSHPSKFREFPSVVKRMKGIAGEKTTRSASELAGLSHLGIGLPLSKVYAEFWGGTISVRVVEGWGTDVYVRLGLGNRLENVLAES